VTAGVDGQLFVNWQPHPVCASGKSNVGNEIVCADAVCAITEMQINAMAAVGTIRVMNLSFIGDPPGMGT
jgi:hypothetical protein